MNFSKSELTKELIALPQELIREILILIPTQTLIVEVCNYNSILQRICHSNNFWPDKMANDYPEYKEELIQNNHIRTLLMLDRGREIPVNSSSEYVTITVNTSFAELVAHFKPRLIKSIALQEFCYQNNRIRGPTAFYVTIIRDKVYINSPSIKWRTNFPNHTPLYSIKFFEDKRLYYELTHVYVTD